MPTYSYTGLSEAGTPLDGVVEAYDEIEAMEQARNLCRVVRSVKEVKESKNFLTMEIGKPKVKPKKLSIMCSQFAIILQAGLPIGRAVALVSEQAEDKYLHKILIEVTKDVSSGHGLADSLENKGPFLPRVLIETIRAGEETGRLAEAFMRLQTYFDKRAKVASKVSGALTYPIFVLVIAVIVVIVMMVMVIPAMTGMISSMGGEIPAITQFLIDTSSFMSQNIVVILAVLALMVVGILVFKRTERGKVFFATMQMRLPVIGTIAVYSSAAQFANTMATLIASGLPMTNAVRVTARVMDNYVLSRQVGRIEADLEEGRSLGECVGTIPYLPKTLTEMTAVGEQSGELEETLETVGVFYDSETQRVTDKALSLLEPGLLMVMAVFAGFIVVALYLPMFTMYSSMM
ncbi:MAG: type II secretion system F family protein [Gordonibacter sp.]|uniref:type II secretion system F family protein n=1 Tax=Gordonibacter sp. TaxID=1968902 RepID=UPI002FCA8011